MTDVIRIGDVGKQIYLVNSRGQPVRELLQIDSILKEDVKIFAGCKLMILYLGF